MKLCILAAYKFLTKNLNFGVSQCISGQCDITKHGIYKICHISDIFKDRDCWFGPKNSIKYCAEHFTTLVVIKHISDHVSGHKLFCSIEKCQYL